MSWVDDDYDYWDDDGPPLERVLEDGTVVDADEPLPLGMYLHRKVEEADYDDEGVVDSVRTFIETIRVTPEMAASRHRSLPMPVARRLPRRVVPGRRRPRSRGGSARARSPGRPADDDPSGLAQLADDSRSVGPDQVRPRGAARGDQP
jgi:hypothetical protein